MGITPSGAGCCIIRLSFDNHLLAPADLMAIGSLRPFRDKRCWLRLGQHQSAQVLQVIPNPRADPDCYHGPSPTPPNLSRAGRHRYRDGAPATNAPKSPTAAVPPQARRTTQLAGRACSRYQLVNPGGMSPLSQLQAAQAAGHATNLTSLNPSFHRLTRCASNRPHLQCQFEHSDPATAVRRKITGRPPAR
jgi:hypothetical protein